jgi:PAS domain S-box-containing protein
MHDSASVMGWRSRPDMSCEHLSPGWLDFTGYSLEAALGDGWSRGVHPEDLSRWLETCLRAYDAHQPFEIEYRLRRHDGEYRWVLDRGEPRYSCEGVFLGYAGACVDIDERKRAESELARALERERRQRSAQNRSIADLLEPQLAGVRVLVVDDDPRAGEAMLRVLHGAGAEAKSVASGSEALQALRAWRPDVLLAKPIEPVALLATLAKLVRTSVV